MQGKHLYEYAVIRLVPKVEREEFFNVGVILFSKRAGYIKSVCQVNEDKLKLYVSEVDRELVFAHLDVFNKICSGAKDGGPDRKSTRLNSSHPPESRMPSSA